MVAAIVVWALGFPAASRAWQPDPPSEPEVTGTPQQGQTLTAPEFSRTYPWTDYGYEWLRCGATGEDCAPIAGATAQTYVVAAADVGQELRVQRTAKDFVVIKRSERSAATSVVLPPAPTTGGVAQGLAVVPVSLVPAPVTVSHRGVAPIEVGCPTGASGGCRGTVTIRLWEPAAKRSSAVAARCGRGCRPLGTANYEARAGKKARVRVHIASLGRRMLRRRGSLRVTVTASSVNNGRSTTTTRTTTLREAK
ncbi:MAG TPA: hypothetical protein VMB91_03155 [Solirubrobacteraceae bacterium]|nr:hypothetical protein [Solirubrobacteraceae bacterium]